MRGTTNAQGLTWPDLTETIQRLQNNPPVGSVTTFAGFDWIVVHWDTENERIYLMLKGLYTRTPWADSGEEHVPYENSKVKAELLNFENLLRARLHFSYENNESLITASGPYAFIPTLEQFQNFSLFRKALTVIPVQGGYHWNYYSYAIATDYIATGEWNTAGWWLSSCEFAYQRDGKEFWTYYTVGGSGETGGTTISSDSYDNVYSRVGVRPFICVKMR